jgi:hypothetical protein
MAVHGLLLAAAIGLRVFRGPLSAKELTVTDFGKHKNNPEFWE